MRKRDGVWLYGRAGRPHEQLSPIPHAWLDNHYRVPITTDEDDYIVHTGKDMIRMYTIDTMPDYVKVKITIVNAQGEPLMTDEQIRTPLDVYDVAHLISKEAQEIGWRVSPSTYVIVLPNYQLYELIGEQNDPRSQSQSKG